MLENLTNDKESMALVMEMMVLNAKMENMTDLGEGIEILERLLEIMKELKAKEDSNAS